MTVFLGILTALFFSLLVLVSAIRLRPSGFSQFELERRAKTHPDARRMMQRDTALPDIRALLMFKGTVLLVLTTIFAILTFGWGWGVVVALLLATVFQPLSRVGIIERQARNWYQRFEPNLMQHLPKVTWLARLLRHDSDGVAKRFHSREELQHMVLQSGDILTKDEQALIRSALAFNDQTVDSVMTPKSQIVSIKKGEFLGPLVLSELHDAGHSRLPVIHGDIDHVVGILYLRDLLSLDNKRSVTAEKAMDPKVFYIRYDDTLQHALAAFLKTHHHLFIVINDQRETVGLLTIEDVIEALIGRAIVDEDDNHGDLRAVAAGKGERNNLPNGHVDV